MFVEKAKFLKVRLRLIYKSKDCISHAYCWNASKEKISFVGGQKCKNYIASTAALSKKHCTYH
jgi:hypothetical protein